MKLKIVLIIFPLFIFAKIPFNNHTELWTSYSCSFPISNKVLVCLETEFKNHGKKLYYKHYQAGLSYVLHPTIFLSTNYRQIYRTIKKKRGHCTMVDFNIKNSFNGWILSNRFRTMYFIKEQNNIVFRNRVLLETPLSLTIIDMSPYLSYEFFFKKFFTRDEERLTFGIKIPRQSNTHMDLYYMLNKKNKILGVNFYLYF